MRSRLEKRITYVADEIATGEKMGERDREYTRSEGEGSRMKWKCKTCNKDKARIKTQH